MRSKRVLAQVAADSCEFIQAMNDRYTKPSGTKAQQEEMDIKQDANQGAVVEAESVS